MSRLRAKLIDRRDARSYDRAASRAISALWDMAALEECWRNQAGVDTIGRIVTEIADLADEVEAEIGV